MRLPTPGVRYDMQNEAATRAEIERAVNRLAPPAVRPVITGSRSGATVAVLTALLSALAGMGLIDDQTTA